MKPDKQNIFIATITGGSFLTSFVFFNSLAEKQFLAWFPSQYEDDVRFDLLLPIFGSSYVISASVSFLIGLLVSKLVGISFSSRTHAKFALMIPVIFLVAYMIIAAVFILFLAIGFHNEGLDSFLVKFIGFVVVIGSYYLLLNRGRRAH